MTGFVARLFQPVDAASVVFFRIAFGVLMAIELIRYWAFGWFADYWVDPDFHFKYFGFEWVEPLPGIGMYLVLVALIASCLLIAAGAFYRVSASVFFIGFSYLFLLDQAKYLNHFYLICLFAFLLTLIPAHVDGSLDARREPKLSSSTVPAWTVMILRFQIAVAYVFAGIAKLTPDWLAGQPLTMWLQATDHLPDFMKLAETGIALSWAGAMLDLAVVPLLLWHRTRVAAFVLITLFHLTNAWMFSIGIFPWFAIAATLLFFPPDAQIFRRVTRPIRLDAAPSSHHPNRATVAFLVIWIAAQIVVPLRHFAYPGNVHWTEEGHRFAWHMKLRSKSATGSFFVVEQRTAKHIRVDASDFLTPGQEAKMMTRPDMILQFAHFLAGEYSDRGPIEVRAQIYAGLNGRSISPFTDPEVDLSQQARTLRHVEWVMPFPTEEKR